MSDRFQGICQIKCQNRCMNRYQVKWQVKCQNICQNRCLKMSWWGSLEAKLARCFLMGQLGTFEGTVFGFVQAWFKIYLWLLYDLFRVDLLRLVQDLLRHVSKSIWGRFTVYLGLVSIYVKLIQDNLRCVESSSMLGLRFIWCRTQSGLV